MVAVCSRRCCGRVALTGCRPGRAHGGSCQRRRSRRSECCGRCACSSGMPACLPALLPAWPSRGPPLRRRTSGSARDPLMLMNGWNCLQHADSRARSPTPSTACRMTDVDRATAEWLSRGPVVRWRLPRLGVRRRASARPAPPLCCRQLPVPAQERRGPCHHLTARGVVPCHHRTPDDDRRLPSWLAAAAATRPRAQPAEADLRFARGEWEILPIPRHVPPEHREASSIDRSSRPRRWTSTRPECCTRSPASSRPRTSPAPRPGAVATPPRGGAPPLGRS